MGLLSLVTFLPIVGAIVLAFLPNGADKLAKMVALAASVATFLVSLAVLASFKAGTYHFQLQESFSWIAPLGVTYHLGVDGISIWLVVLTTFLTIVATAYSYYVDVRVKTFLALILVLETAMVGSFLALDLILFFTFFELTLLPMYFLIGIWGGARRGYAANKFLIYTFAGSIFMFVGMVALALQYQRATGNLSFDVVAIQQAVANGSLWANAIQAEGFIFWGFALALLVKTPAFPFHTWVPDTYSESPIAAPILSSVMVKMGTYGFLRFCLPLFPDVVATYIPILMTLAVIGIVYGAIVAAVQPDLRRLLAYSSVSHMGFVLLGIFSLTHDGMMGGAYQQINHGITTGALFLLVGFFAVRRGTTLFKDMGGLKAQMPVYAALFLLAMLGSVSLPGTNGFVGEFLALLGAFESGYANLAGLNVGFAVVAGAGVVLAAVYLLYMFQQIFYGPNVNPENRRLRDIKPWETGLAAILVVFILWGGLYPTTFLRPMEASVQAARLMATGPANLRPAWADSSEEIDTATVGANQGALVRGADVIAPGSLHPSVHLDLAALPPPPTAQSANAGAAH